MLHLNTERLAALADDEPTAEEALHISECFECARERVTYRALLRLARREAQAVTEPPASKWSTLSAQLRDEGLIRATSGHVAGSSAWWLRAAAAILVVGGAAVAGRWSAPAVDGGSAARASTTIAAPAGTTTRLANGSGTTSTSPLQFSSVADAVAVLERAQREYRAAAAFLAAQDTLSPAGENPERFRARLAALDEISGAALSAASDLPLDPIINQYYQATLTARQVTLRQIGNMLPTGVRLAGY